MRIAITIAYDGSAFYGSQSQTNLPTVLGTMQHALHHLGIDAKLIASGRTDKGVHALAQVCHLDLPAYWSDLENFRRRFEANLPGSIRIRRVKAVEATFHARYDAIKRTYRYILKSQAPSIFENRFVTYAPKANFQTIRDNIALFQGRHDFSAFYKTGSQTTSCVRTIYKAFAYTYKDYIVLHYEANGFLRSQIRMMTAALIQYDADVIDALLKQKTTRRIKPLSPNGLYLAKVRYPRK